MANLSAFGMKDIRFVPIPDNATTVVHITDRYGTFETQLFLKRDEMIRLADAINDYLDGTDTEALAALLEDVVAE